MTFKTIMVHFDLDGEAAPRINFARELAQRFEAGLIAFAAAQPHVFVPRGDSGVLTAELMRQRTREIEERLDELKREFHEIAGDGEKARWRGSIGFPTDLLISQARAADLIVTATPDRPAPSHRSVDAGSLILAAGRPVLFMSEAAVPLRASSVLVAWKDARESRRAVADALPFLIDADDVLVMTIAEGDQQEASASAADVVRFLERHGVNARSDVLGIGANAAAEALLGTAAEIGADLVVAGGYGHSRMREWAFGGVTRSLLGERSVHRLLSN
jgi:nucleotide-binding universal stress UspA family protein